MRKVIIGKRKPDSRGWHDPRRNHRNGNGDKVCECRAYKYPHRLFGGRCRPQAWVESYFECRNPDCEDCINRDGHECQVVTQTEATFHCPALRDFVRYEGIVLYGSPRRQFERSAT